ncbi:DUF6252 family protein [Flavobacterium sp.]|uniref:DUF6252 family protein n=1 Tax=Flavobacterium sp. TaxID=239 RepID=UPI00352807AB
MKKIFSFLVVILLISSCTQDIKDNTPAFQATKDNALWKAGDASVHIEEDGSVTITAYRDYETIVLSLSDAEVGTYYFGSQNQSSYAEYSYNDETTSLLLDTDIYPGPVYQLKQIVNAGTNYLDSNNSLTQFAVSSPSNGSGLRLAIEANPEGAVTSASIISRGDGYYPGDVVTIVGGDNNATVSILNTQLSHGQVVIEKIENGMFTGSFTFSATDGNGNVASFSDGYFYRLPIR